MGYPKNRKRCNCPTGMKYHASNCVDYPGKLMNGGSVIRARYGRIIGRPQ